MSGTQLIQTKQAIAALKAAGFSRDEFSVRTPYQGDKHGYGRAEIYLRAPAAKQIELIPAMVAQGLSVTRWFDKDEKESCPIVRADWLGRLDELHVAQVEREYEELMQRIAKYDDEEAK